MLAIGNRECWSRRDAGFTLIELLVALAIAALVAGIAFPALQHQLTRSAQIEARMTLKLALTQARADAIARAMPVRVSFLPGRGVLQLSSARPAMILPPRTSLEWPEQDFVFYADGTANGGNGAIQSAGQVGRVQGRRFYVDAATSQIVLEQ